MSMSCEFLKLKLTFVNLNVSVNYIEKMKHSICILRTVLCYNKLEMFPAENVFAIVLNHNLKLKYFKIIR